MGRIHSWQFCPLPLQLVINTVHISPRHSSVISGKMLTFLPLVGFPVCCHELEHSSLLVSAQNTRRRVTFSSTGAKREEKSAKTVFCSVWGGNGKQTGGKKKVTAQQPICGLSAWRFVAAGRRTSHEWHFFSNPKHHDGTCQCRRHPATKLCQRLRGPSSSRFVV